MCSLVRIKLATPNLRTVYISKMDVFWVVAPCSLVEVDRRFRGSYRLHHQGDDGGSMHL
jgi:hypothetical protein